VHILDVILAACDVEGNFLVVKVGEPWSFGCWDSTFSNVAIGLSIHDFVVVHAPGCVSSGSLFQ
jgi:hypothetical protein